MRVKYRCSHCDHTCELDDKEFRRCPNCFWTTSLEPLGEARAETTPSSGIQKPTAQQEKTARKIIPGKLILLLILIAITAILGVIFFRRGGRLPQLPSFKLPAINLKPDFSKDKLAKEAVKRKPAQSAEGVLSKEELRELERAFQITIPRQLTSDEEEILKKQVSSPAKLSEKPKISVWKKEDFEKLIESEQKTRKITLGWFYVRNLGEVFEKNYIPAVQAVEKEDYALARELFIKSLAFPVYRDNVVRHRAVVLVMLRPYVNEVIGKIAVINQHLLVQELSAEANAIFGVYQEIFPILELAEWDRALQMIAELKQRIGAFESRPQNAQVIYPPAFGLIDTDLQAAIQNEASPKPEAAVSFKSLVIDLNLKEKVVRQNTAEELLKIQKQFEQMLKLIENKGWEAARNALMSVEFPPELVEEARQKAALIEKILAIQEQKSK